MSCKDKYISDLESEIQYLKKLLDDNGISYDYEAHLRALQSEVGDIVFPELGPEHASLLYSYFKGRRDVYAVRSNKGKGYYSKCNNAFSYGICPKKSGAKIKCQDCPSRDYTELRGKVILDHLQGNREDCGDVVGLYPLFPDSTCWFLVFDFDNHDEESEPSKGWEQEVNALRQMCTILGVDALVERSRSGRGAHVWIFFSDPIQASKARKFGEALLRKGAESVSLKNFRYYDRMMPMQDSLPEGKLGNLIALPLQGRALKNGNSAFVDESWITYKDQWKRLRETRKLSEKEVDELIRLWCPDDDTMSIFQNDIEEDVTGQTPLLFGQSPASSRRNFHSEDADGVVKIYLSDGIYVNKKGLKDRMQNAIRRIAAYSNPQFFQTLQLGFSTKDTPRIVYNGYDEGDYIVIPRGCYDELISQLSSAGVRYEVMDKRQRGRKIDVCFNGELYPEQQIAAEKMLCNDIGVLAAATAFGKTVLGAYMIAQKKVNALVLVHNVEIMNNWVSDLTKFLSINEDLPTYTTPSGRLKKRKSLIGTFSSQKNNLTGIIDVVMVSSLGKDGNVNPMVKDYGMVIMDECHHGAAYTSESVLRAISAKYVYGLTATTKRDDGQERRMFMQLGPVRYKYSAKERAEKQGIGHFIYPRFTRLVDLSENITITEALSLVARDELRNLQIVADVKECIRLGRTPIVMTKRKDHAAILYDMLKGEARHTFLLQGGGSMKERAALREKMAAVPSDESMLAVAIGQYIGEGFNYPRLDTLLLAMPISFEGNVEQYAGRLNRDYEGKQDVIIFDYIDRYIPILERMYYKRLRTYKRIGFDICSQVVDKQDISNSIYDYTTYSKVFSQDMSSANSSVIISSPGLGTSKIWQFVRQLPMIQERGVKTTVITMSPSLYPEDAVKHQEELVQILRSSGIDVKTQDNCKEHFAVIDGSIVWYGSMNFLSREREDDNLMRIESKSIAQEVLLRYAQGNR